jgi:hypothetical protein
MGVPKLRMVMKISWIIPQVVGKISGLMNKWQESVSKTNSFTSVEECATDKDLVGKHTKPEVCSSFYP